MDFKDIEEKWQKKWEEEKIFEGNTNPEKEKFLLTFPFPYMNGPLHLGHLFTATRVDVYARFKRMQGFNVLFPWAWHYTGESIPGAVKRIKENDQLIIKAIRDIDGVPESEIKKFVDPLYLARYYTNDAIESIKRIGFSIDWRRSFTTVDPIFSKFIEWQYFTLKDKGYVIKGTHPVVYCPSCESPTGDHDRLVGEGVSPAEFMLLKFKYDDMILPAATLRLETIYGVTNMWLNPEVNYVKAKVNDEIWLVSKECALKLKHQGFEVKELEEVKGTELIGKYCFNPIIKNKIIILPASFVDPNIGTGVVMSVPSHAPYDYIGLEDLIKNPEELKKYDIDLKNVKEIEPISLISLEGFGEHPAIELCKQMNVKNQEDKEKLDKATEELYKKEFHQGILKNNVKKYSGLKVIEAKPVIIEDFKKLNIATKFFDLPEEVVCKCSTKCIVKILQNQWFLKYSDEDWKNLTKKCLEKMEIYPEEARKWFEATIDWLEEKACTRKIGLGTKLPWDKEWLVETLSDSTIYMAFYTISHLIRKYKIEPEDLTREFFDYIFTGKEFDKKDEKWEEMKKEFEYWYPVDFRNSAKELIPNHLTFFLFQHVAIFPEKYWPKIIGANGMINIEGEKMSKSRGVFITARQALDWYGSDAARFALMNTSEGMNDADFRKKEAESTISTINNFYSTILKILELKEDNEKKSIDTWLLSRLQKNIKEATEAYEVTKFKTALHYSFFNMFSDLRWYLRKRNTINRKIINEFITKWIKLVSPLIPFISEELWEKIGNKNFVSLEKWPDYDSKLINLKIEFGEELIKQTIKDIEEIKKLSKIEKPEKITIFTTSHWKYEVYNAVLQGTELKELMQKEEFKKIGNVLINYYKKLQKKKPLDELFLTAGYEHEVLEEAKEFLEKEFDSTVEIIKAEESKHPKALVAEPSKPGILVE